MGTSTASGVAPRTIEPGPAVHDFDFYLGSWRVHHRRLVERLAGSDDWQEFEGTSTAWPILDGAGNIDDNVLELPGGTYRAISLRSYDPATDRWSIWWLDGRSPARLDPPVVGGFEDGIGTFIAEDTFDGRPILVRFLWSDITDRTCRWEQAFSEDGGATWEVNWVMESTRVDLSLSASLDLDRVGRVGVRNRKGWEMGSWPSAISAITLFVEDLAATKRFYVDVFDLPVDYEDDVSAVFRFGETLINLLQISEAPELIAPAAVASPDAGSRFQFTITVDDVDAVCADLKARGVAFLNGPMDRPWGIRTAAFRDPAGHIWEIAK